MSAIRPLLAAILLSATVPSLARAQAASPDSARARAVRATLRSDLRNFVTAQERYYANHETYAARKGEVETVFVPSRGVTLILLTASERGHSEIAIHENLAGFVCAMYVGNAPPPLGKGGEGEVVCEDRR